MESKLIVTRNFLMKEILKLAGTDTRRCFQKIYCDGENFVVTDGKILLFTPSEGKEKGYYEMSASGTGKKKVTYFNPVSCDAPFPIWKAVVPDSRKAVCSFDFNIMNKEPIALSKSVFQLQFLLSTILPEDYFLSWTYLSLIAKTNLFYKVYIAENSFVTFEAENPLRETFSLVVLPVRAGNSITQFTKDYKEQLLKKWEVDKNNGI